MQKYGEYKAYNLLLDFKKDKPYGYSNQNHKHVNYFGN